MFQLHAKRILKKPQPLLKKYLFFSLLLKKQTYYENSI